MSGESNPQAQMQKEIKEIHAIVHKMDKRSALASLSIKGAWLAIVGLAKVTYDLISNS